MAKAVQNHAFVLQMRQENAKVAQMYRSRKITAAGIEGRYFQR
jgi:hypothetical protein